MNYLAQIDIWELEGVSAPKLRGRNLGYIISQFTDYIFPLGGILVLIFLVFAGYQYMTSQGDPKSIAAAQQRMTWAIVGFVILFLSYWFTAFIGEALNIQAIKDMFGGA